MNMNAVTAAYRSRYLGEPQPITDQNEPAYSSGPIVQYYGTLGQDQRPYTPVPPKPLPPYFKFDPSSPFDKRFYAHDNNQGWTAYAPILLANDVALVNYWVDSVNPESGAITRTPGSSVTWTPSLPSYGVWAQYQQAPHNFRFDVDSSGRIIFGIKNDKTNRVDFYLERYGDYWLPIGAKNAYWNTNPDWSDLVTGVAFVLAAGTLANLALGAPGAAGAATAGSTSVVEGGATAAGTGTGVVEGSAAAAGSGADLVSGMDTLALGTSDASAIGLTGITSPGIVETASILSAGGAAASGAAASGAAASGASLPSVSQIVSAVNTVKGVTGAVTTAVGLIRQLQSGQATATPVRPGVSRITNGQGQSVDIRTDANGRPLLTSDGWPILAGNTIYWVAGGAILAGLLLMGLSRRKGR
jgi:hypothetical protein